MTKAKILIVEDDAFYAFWLAETIKKKAGYEVFTARNGLEALEKFALLMPDIVFLDINIPYIDGLKVGKLLRYYLPEAEYVMIYLTVKEDVEFQEYAIFDLRAFDYLEKAYTSPEEIVMKINGGLRLLESLREMGREGCSYVDLQKIPLDSLISVLFQRNWKGYIKLKCEDGFEETIFIDPLKGVELKSDSDVLEFLSELDRHGNCWAEVMGEAVHRGIRRGRLSLFLESFKYRFPLNINFAVIYDLTAHRLEAENPPLSEEEKKKLMEVCEVLTMFGKAIESVKFISPKVFARFRNENYLSLPLTERHCMVISFGTDDIVKDNILIAKIEDIVKAKHKELQSILLP